ncbi:prepilin peptidase [bacterium]|nr:prepilin peptidase [bacterium]
MQIILIIFAFLVGIVSASFLNALMYRLDKEYKYPNIFVKPSHCEKCNKQLKSYDLVPILSYIFSRGKCSKCGSKITVYYPISELILGISFALFFLNGVSWFMYFVLIFLFCLCYFDYIYKAIPQVPTLLFNVLGIMYVIVLSVVAKELVLNALLSGILLLSGMCILLIVMYGIKGFTIKDGLEGLGSGDFLILFGLSMLLSIEQFWVMFWISILLALLFFIPSSILGKMNLKSSLPLLPFFTLGYIVVVVYGESIFEYVEGVLMM